MTPSALLKSISVILRRSGIPDPETDSALLLSFLSGRHPLSLRLDTETELDDSLIENYSALINRRLKREPLQYITGEAPFFSRMFKVDSRVLIPRPETELLCEWALELISVSSSFSLLDLCCGSGCIGLTLSAERPALRVSLADISMDAISVAKENAALLNVTADFRCCNLAEDFEDESFDFIVSNPPYIPSPECPHLQDEVLYEPLQALDGGDDGLDFYRRIAAESIRVLKPSGKLLMELGYDESASVYNILEASGYSDILIRKDFNGHDRMILATVPARRYYV